MEAADGNSKDTQVMTLAREAVKETVGQRGLAVIAPSGSDAAALASLQAVMPDSLGGLVQMAQAFAKSQIVPKSLRNKPDDCLIVLMAGLEMRLTPIRAVQNITVISGNLAIKADMQLAQVRGSGLVEYFDEGFEIKGSTDADLAERVPNAMVHRKILAAITGTPNGKPYGWAVAQRRGETQQHVRVFAWEDADRATTTAWEDTGSGDREKKKIKLHEKDTYQNYPQDIYPRRARCRVLALLFSDALNGIPAVETIDGEVIDAEPITTVTVKQQQHDDVEQLLAKLPDDLRQRVAQAFDSMGIQRAKQLLLLKTHGDDAEKILDELLAEHDKRKGTLQAGQEPRKVPRKTKKAAAQEPAAPAADDKPQVTDVQATEEPVAPKAPAKKRTF